MLMELVLPFYRLDHNNYQGKTQVVETSIAIQWLRLPFLIQREWILFLVRELDSHNSSWPKKQKHKTEAKL